MVSEQLQQFQARRTRAISTGPLKLCIIESPSIKHVTRRSSQAQHAGVAAHYLVGPSIALVAKVRLQSESSSVTVLQTRLQRCAQRCQDLAQVSAALQRLSHYGVVLRGGTVIATLHFFRMVSRAYKVASCGPDAAKATISRNGTDG